MPSELPSYYQPLSLRLYQVMEDIGATVDMRNTMKNSSITREILQTIAFQQDELTSYIFGSSYEGTTTPGMDSDNDTVLISDNLPVVIDCAEHPYGKSLLLLQDRTNPAGYCKLQLVQNGNPQVRECFELTNLPFFKNSFNGIFTSCVDRNNRLVCTLKSLSERLRVFPEHPE